MLSYYFELTVLVLEPFSWSLSLESNIMTEKNVYIAVVKSLHLFKSVSW